MTILYLLLLLMGQMVHSTDSCQAEKNWTILYYAAGSNSSEVDLLADVREMMSGKVSTAYNMILLIDRIEGYSSDSTTLGEDFSDTRLYQIEYDQFIRLCGGKMLPAIQPDQAVELNMGDANTLKQFIRFGKANYPARQYMLILRSHGNGMGMCADAESGERDRLYSGEIAEVLSAEESVDILGLDVCSMAGLENLYEWRPDGPGFGADYIIASAPLSAAWAYDRILNRLQTNISPDEKSGSNHFSSDLHVYYDPDKLDPATFAKLIFEEVYASQRWASWGLFDNHQITAVKTAIDAAAKALWLEPDSIIISVMANTLGYFHQTSPDLETAQLTFPYADAFDFWDQLSHHPNLRTDTRQLASTVCREIDSLVIYSYYGEGFLPTAPDFKDGQHGIYQIMPIGNRIYSQTGRTFWAHSTWFHPDGRSDNAFGLYDWCSDGAFRGNGQVENFFEYQDYLFDHQDPEAGGVNQYGW